MNNTIKMCLGTFITATLLLGACSQPARYIETGGTESVVSVGEVDIQDIQMAASGMLESLLETGILKRAPHQPARLVMDEWSEPDYSKEDGKGEEKNSKKKSSSSGGGKSNKDEL